MARLKTRQDGTRNIVYNQSVIVDAKRGDHSKRQEAPYHPNKIGWKAHTNCRDPSLSEFVRRLLSFQKDMS
ncbi:uncharacterized protein PHALS_02202 [Plasmopara halstedii]|uniref:Uncharacterized protein n=1 Tax=Plasmopara halstedii TaxID=4781 RepID=A0A0P1A7Y7_PLAHL|nr:uncharacterized protein PHALS_02202 [Plasmopara halstedii]CEG36293.1 hypothetical protein PHALS_02202 [Plasmopara halstedii]|eukprot:XP_024572662.1 hypothetical protein PHALS_02202 [Plasmopara halstedii]